MSVGTGLETTEREEIPPDAWARTCADFQQSHYGKLIRVQTWSAEDADDPFSVRFPLRKITVDERQRRVDVMLEHGDTGEFTVIGLDDMARVFATGVSVRFEAADGSFLTLSPE